MLLKLFLLFILIPIVELVVLIWLAQATSWLTTAIIVFATGIIGASLARWQGFRAWNAVRADMAAGRPPTASVVDGVLILIAGLLLLTPGLISDTTGFLLLIPPLRRVVRQRVIAGIRSRIELRVQSAIRRPGRNPDDIIDAEFHHSEDSTVRLLHPPDHENKAP